MSDQPIVLYLSQAAALLDMPPGRLYELTRQRGRTRLAHPVPFFKLGRRLAFTRAALEEWVLKLQARGGR